MIKKFILLLLMIVVASCSANHSVVRTTKPDPRKLENQVVQRVRKPIYRPADTKKSVAITQKDTPTTENYNNATEVLEATTRVKVTTQMVLAYIEKYKEVAKDNMIRTGIPASITLGQALLESGAGTGTERGTTVHLRLPLAGSQAASLPALAQPSDPPSPDLPPPEPRSSS